MELRLLFDSHPSERARRLVPPGQQAEAAGALNLGLKDQRFALEWVKKNIGLFGGDASKVRASVFVPISPT